MKKQQVINVINDTMDSLQNHFPTIYHRNDVTILLANLRRDIEEMEDEPEAPTEQPIGMTPAVLHEIINYTLDYAKNTLIDNTENWDWDEMCEVDLDSAEFSMRYDNCVELDSAKVDTSNCSSNVDGEIKATFKELNSEDILREFDNANGTSLSVNTITSTESTEVN